MTTWRVLDILNFVAEASNCGVEQPLTCFVTGELLSSFKLSWESILPSSRRVILDALLTSNAAHCTFDFHIL